MTLTWGGVWLHWSTVRDGNDRSSKRNEQLRDRPLDLLLERFSKVAVLHAQGKSNVELSVMQYLWCFCVVSGLSPLISVNYR